MNRMFRPTSRMLMQPTRRMLNVSEIDAGTTSIRFQKLKAIPVEVYPLGVIVGFMCSFGIFSMGKALFFGKNLRKHRQARDEENA